MSSNPNQETKQKKKRKTKEYKVPSKKQPVFKIFGKIIGLSYKCEVESLIDEIPDKAIVVANHSAKQGPMALELNYPKFNVKWGAHEMLGSYKSRFLYLRNVLYIQKLHKSKLFATLKAAFEAIFSIYVYKGMKFIGTYPDIRIRHTIENSMKVLDAGATVMIFPENSNEGYFDELVSVFPGFVMLAERYYKKTGEDVPVIPAYYSKKHKKIIVGRPLYVQELVKEGLDRQGVADRFKDEINALYKAYFKDK